jgi:hypothetical protein
MNSTQTTIQSAIETLARETGRWVTNSLPDLTGYIEFEFTAEQFALAQSIISGANLGPSLEDSVSFLVARECQLHEEASGNDEEHGCYALGNSYCSSGWTFLNEQEMAAEKSALCLWYETTSGTILVHLVSPEGSHGFWVYLPEARKWGTHYTELSRVAAGMTRDQYDRWYNSYCLGDEKLPDYAEWADWHNAKMVPLGFKPMITGEQLAMDRQIDKALQYVHGDWAQKYGIATHISALLGYGDAFFASEPKPGKTLKGRERLEQAALVLKDLEQATANWKALLGQWTAEDGISSEDYLTCEDEDYEDYDGDETDLDFDEE